MSRTLWVLTLFIELLSPCIVMADEPDPKVMKSWVEYYKEIARSYEIGLRSAPNTFLTVVETPVLVYSNPTSGRENRRMEQSSHFYLIGIPKSSLSSKFVQPRKEPDGITDWRVWITNRSVQNTMGKPFGKIPKETQAASVPSTIQLQRPRVQMKLSDGQLIFRLWFIYVGLPRSKPFVAGKPSSLGTRCIGEESVQVEFRMEEKALTGPLNR